jgi:hypothetical protein
MVNGMNSTMNTATYNTNLKTFAITSNDVARAMIFNGNPYNHNRAKGYESATAARAAMLAAGFVEV